MNKRTASAEADVLLGESLEIINNATGLQFKIDGETSEPPAAQRAPYQPARYPGRWAPVLVAWSDPQEYPGIDGDVAGVGGSALIPVANHRVYVTGDVTLDGPSLKTILKHPDGPEKAKAILLHELAHLVGLDHVADPDQLMNSANTGQVSFGPGDLAGLAQLGRGTCYPDV